MERLASKDISLADVREEPTAPPFDASSAASSAAPVSGATIARENGERSPIDSPGRRRLRDGSAAAATNTNGALAAPAVSASAPSPAPLPANSKGDTRAATPAAVPGHKTVRVRPRVYGVPMLSDLCVRKLAEHSDSIIDLRGVGEESARQLLKEIMWKQKLTYPLVKVFMDCGDEELSNALARLNLWDAIPAGRQGRHGKHL